MLPCVCHPSKDPDDRDEVVNLVLGDVGVGLAEAEMEEQALRAVQHEAGSGHSVEPVDAGLYDAGFAVFLQSRREGSTAEEGGLVFDGVGLIHAARPRALENSFPHRADACVPLL